MFPSRALSTAVLLAVVASPALSRAEEATTLVESVAGGATAGLADSAALLGGYRVGDGVVALVDWEGTSGRVAQGDAGTVSGPGHDPKALACSFSGVTHDVELPLAQLGNGSAVLNGGYRIGDKVLSLIAWENNGAAITRGDVGLVLDSGREDKGLIVSFPRMRRISILLTQVGKMGTPLIGDYSVGDKVTSLISWSGSAGNLAVGDVGVALASGNGGRGLVADFPNIKNLNIMLQQISKAEDSKTAVVPPQEQHQEQDIPKSDVAKSAVVPPQEPQQDLSKTEPAKVAAALSQEPQQQEQDLAKSEAVKSVAAPPQEPQQEQEAEAAKEEQEEGVLTKKASSLSQKLADAARRFSIGKKLQKAKENRDDSELETKPVKRHILQADSWPADSKESLFQRLMGPLLGKKRPSEEEVAALSLAQTGVQLSKKSLLSGVKRRQHDEF